MSHKRQSLVYLVLCASALLAVIYFHYMASALAGVSLGPVAWTLLAAKTTVELAAGFYGIAFLFGSIAYLLMREDRRPRPRRDRNTQTRVGLIYLCCEDLDVGALESLATLSYEGPVVLVVHDDSQTQRMRAEVDSTVQRLRKRRSWNVRLLRRPDKAGGKAGALNYVLDQTGDTYDVFLLCDNDSTITQQDIIEGALPYFSDASTAVVQCRTIAVDDPGYCAVNRRLAQSIAAFHAFLAPNARFGWMPFVGHNAFLRTAAVRHVGGLTPGFFSDDLDLTVRLNLAGFIVAYAPELEVGEKHPPNYAAFRKRSYKWAYGCVQTLRAHWRSVLMSRRFALAEKLSFFQFAGFYCLQCAFVFYLFLALLVVPLGVLGRFALDPWSSVLVGVVMIGLVYAPLLSHVVKSRSFQRGWLGTLVLCGLVYGGTDFSVVRGVVDALLRRKRRWIPTNQVGSSDTDVVLLAEAGCGLVLLLVPLLLFPELLYLPCWYLFAGKFMFGPALSRLYRDATDAQPIPLPAPLPRPVAAGGAYYRERTVVESYDRR